MAEIGKAPLVEMAGTHPATVPPGSGEVGMARSMASHHIPRLTPPEILPVRMPFRGTTEDGNRVVLMPRVTAKQRNRSPVPATPPAGPIQHGFHTKRRSRDR